MARSTSSVPPASLQLYDALVAGNPAVERKGASVPYTAVNGNMFSYLSQDGALNLRLPAGEREAFLEKYDTTLCTAYGVVQKEYVVVPDALLRKTRELQTYFDASHAYATTLKPKPTAAAKKSPARKAAAKKR